MLHIDSNETKATIFSLTAAIVYTIACFWDSDPEVYLFPRILAVIMVTLSLVQLFKASREKAEPSTIPAEAAIQWKVLFPGLAVTVVFVLSIETIGFYTGSFLAFLCIVLFYGKRNLTDPRALLYKSLIGLVLMLVLYGLFWKLLYVRTPEGWLI